MNNVDVGMLTVTTIHQFLHVHHSCVAWYKRIPYLQKNGISTVQVIIEIQNDLIFWIYCVI